MAHHVKDNHHRGQRAGAPPANGSRRSPAVANARVVALRAIAEVEADDETQSPGAIARALADAGVADPRDRALATELVYGVLRWRARLDHTLSALVSRPWDDVDPDARRLLRLGAYQIMALDRIPVPIAVSAIQDAARAAGLGHLTGLLNGVLRQVANRGPRPAEGDGPRAISVRTSLPEWIVRALADAYGRADAETEGRALRDRAQTTVRATIARGGVDALGASLAEEGFAIEPAAHGTVAITGPGDPFATAAFAEGMFVPQDPASLAVIDFMGDVAGLRVLDLCAGRGVKATALADRGAHVVAADVAAGKLEQLQQLAAKLGVAERIAHVHAGDMTAPDATVEGAPFDRVLVDAPCTGLGTLRRHPEIAWRRGPDDVRALAAIQADLLATAARLVAPGGEIVYAVCTFTRGEGAPPIPDGLERVERVDIRPSTGVDAFQAARFRKVAR